MKISKKNPLVYLVLLTIIFSGCSDDDNALPYKLYSSLVNQSKFNTPTESILTNQLDLSITWTRMSAGKYEGTLSRSIDLTSTTIVIQLQEVDRLAAGGFKDSRTIQLHVLDRYNLYDTRDGIMNAQLEIRQFPK